MTTVTPRTTPVKWMYIWPLALNVKVHSVLSSTGVEYAYVSLTDKDRVEILSKRKH